VDSNGCLGAGDPQCWPAAVNESPTKEGILVYPNPVKDYWFIMNKESGELDVFISDITGRLLLEKRSSSPKISIDLNQYPSGLYLYRITGREGVLLQGKVVKE